MSSNVGLTTPRGSGTSGYVQRNASLLKPREKGYWESYTSTAGTGENDGPISSANRSAVGQPLRKPDTAILEHERKRRIENRVFELRDRLEEEG